MKTMRKAFAFTFSIAWKALKTAFVITVLLILAGTVKRNLSIPAAKADVIGGSAKTETEAETEHWYYRSAVAKSNLNLRAEATTDSSILTTIANGEEVRIGKREGDWIRVHARGLEGWCCAKYLEYLEPDAEEANG